MSDEHRPRTHYEAAVDALKAQGFRRPGPKLIERVMDAIARAEEETPAGERRYEYDYAELLTDTPELVNRTEGPLEGAEISRVLADVLNKALRYDVDSE
jgi:hypothetical protein